MTVDEFETATKSNSLAAFVERQREKNRKKKLKKKASKARKKEEKKTLPINASSDSDYHSNYNSEIEILDFELKGAFERFKLVADEKEENKNKQPAKHTEINLKARTAEILAEEAERRAGKLKYPAGDDDDFDGAPRKGIGSTEEETVDGNKEVKPLSKKKLKLLSRPSVSELKRVVSRPDVVEMWDVCAKDPMLLVYLKSYRNTVPVPRHWCAKRKYLQGKRGFEKPPFRLPDYIARTGIMEMRQTVQDKEADKNLKAKMRDKIRPKVGRVDIDYHKLHDAFFKYQSKPYLSGHGDLYYEGKEFEVKLKEKKPGNLTEELRNALGLPTGNNAEKYPPPWLIAMQRYGPPPSYPNLKIPGLNAPIPTGCAFGYHPGGWGKPPVDESGRPIYGDVFGNGGNVAGAPPPPPPMATPTPTPAMEAARGEDEALAHGRVPYWGEWESDEEEEEDDDDGDVMGGDSDNDEDMAVEEDKGGEEVVIKDTSGLETPSIAGIATPGGGYVTPSGTSSIGLPLQPALPVDVASVELRKKTIAEQMEDSTGLTTPMGGVAPGQLYRVLPAKEAHVGATDLMGSTKLYDVSFAQETAERGMEAINPRDKMIRKRPANETEGTTPAPSPHPEKPQVPAKKYKEFKF